MCNRLFEHITLVSPSLSGIEHFKSSWRDIRLFLTRAGAECERTERNGWSYVSRLPQNKILKSSWN